MSRLALARFRVTSCLLGLAVCAPLGLVGCRDEAGVDAHEDADAPASGSTSADGASSASGLPGATGRAGASGRGGRAARAGALERVDWRRAEGRPLEARAPRSHALFRLDEGEPPWRALAERTRIEEVQWGARDVGLGSRLQVLEDPVRRRVELRGPFPRAAFDRVRLGVLLAGPQHVRVVLERAGGREESETLELTHAGPRMLDLDFRRRADTAERVDRVLLVFAGEARQVALSSIELLERPLVGPRASGAPLAPDGEAPSFVELGGDARPAWTLAPGAPLECRPTLVPNGLWVLSIGLPEGRETALASARLRVRVASASENEGAGASEHQAGDEDTNGGANGGAKGSGLGNESAREQRSEQATGSAGARADSLELDVRALHAGWNRLVVDVARLVPDAPRSTPPRPRVRLTLECDEELALAVARPLALPAAPGPGSAPAPRVVLVTSDTHRADHVGFAPDARVRTPFLERLAERGVVFTDTWAPANSTQPSHAAILTGRHPRDTGVTYNGKPLGPLVPTLAEAFREAGWLCFAAISASHLHEDTSGLWRGFDRASAPRQGARDSRATLDVLEGWLPEAEGAPLFVWLHLFDAHGPYEPPAELAREEYPAGRDPYDRHRPQPAPGELPEWDRTVRDLDWVEALYRGEVRHLDAGLERLFGRPELSGAWIAITADHGEHLQGDPLPLFNHVGITPGTLAVPLVLSGPGIEGGGVIERGVTNVDLGRTLLDLAGLDAHPFPGRDLFYEGPERARFALESKARSASVRIGSWFLRLHLWSESGGQGQLDHRVELYDLGADPRATRDLAAAQPERARRLRAQLVEWLLEAPARTRIGRDRRGETEHLEQLAGLGYAPGRPGTSELFDADCDCSSCRRFR